MSPLISSAYSQDCIWMNAKFFSYKFLVYTGDIIFSYPNYIFIFKFCIFMALPVLMAKLFYAIKNVFFLCSYEEVRRTNALPIIAPMTNNLSIRDVPMDQPPGHSVGISIPIRNKLTVAIREYISRPVPACFCLINMTPKSNPERNSLEFSSTFPATRVLDIPCFNSAIYTMRTFYHDLIISVCNTIHINSPQGGF